MLDNCLFLAAADADLVASIAGKFGVEWKLIFAQIVNFVLVVYLLNRFAFNPILKTMNERNKRIADGLQYTEEMEQKLKEAEKFYSDQLKKAESDSKNIIDAARQQAKNYTEHQMQEAIAKAEDILKKAQESIILEHNQMLDDVRKEVANLVVKTSSKVLGKNLSDDEKKRFNAAAVEELAIN